MPDQQRYGFRFYSTQNGGGGRPACFEGIVASGYQANFGLGSDVGISIGDPVTRAADGTYELVNDSVATAGRLYGVVMGIANCKLGNNRAGPASYLPGGTTYSTDANTSRLLIAPFSNHIWQIDAAADVGTSGLDDYRDLVGTNADVGAQPDIVPGRPRMNPILILAGITLPDRHFQVVGISGTAENIHFETDYVKMLVQLNMGSDPRLGLSGVDGL